MFKNLFIYFLVISLLFTMPAIGFAKKINVVTTSPILADFARNIGGDKVSVYSIAKGFEDPHFVEPKPSHILKLQKADLYFVVGMDLEIAYSPVLERGANNPDIMKGGRNYIDCSAGISKLEIPDKPDRSQGDVHPQGNPHYLLDPSRAMVVVNTITKALKDRYPEYSVEFENNKEAYTKKLKSKINEWKAKMAPLAGKKAVTYHKSWAYFAQRYGLNFLTTIEPVPGISPSAAHVSKVINLMKNEGVKLILEESYFETSIPNKIAVETGAKLIVVPVEVNANKQVPTYIDLIDYIINKISNAGI